MIRVKIMPLKIRTIPMIWLYDVENDTAKFCFAHEPHVECNAKKKKDSNNIGKMLQLTTITGQDMRYQPVFDHEESFTSSNVNGHSIE